MVLNRKIAYLKKKRKPTAIKKDLVRKCLNHTTDWIDVKSKC